LTVFRPSSVRVLINTYVAMIRPSLGQWASRLDGAWKSVHAASLAASQPRRMAENTTPSPNWLSYPGVERGIWPRRLAMLQHRERIRRFSGSVCPMGVSCGVRRGSPALFLDALDQMFSIMPTLTHGDDAQQEVADGRIWAISRWCGRRDRGTLLVMRDG
jgi:hypothetical protein